MAGEVTPQSREFSPQRELPSMSEMFLGNLLTRGLRGGRRR